MEDEPTPDGQTRPRVHRVIELGSSICYQLPNGDWADADPALQIMPDGSAVASRGSSKITISPDLNNPDGVLEIQASDGRRFRSAPIALVLYSPATGKSVQVAGLVQDGTCEGWQTAPGEITFFGALEGLADLRFRNELGQFHQEILLTRKISPKTLARLGFPSDLSAQPLRLEIWSSFLECPEPAIQTTLLKTESNPLRLRGRGDRGEVALASRAPGTIPRVIPERSPSTKPVTTNLWHSPGWGQPLRLPIFCLLCLLVFDSRHATNRGVLGWHRGWTVDWD